MFFKQEKPEKNFGFKGEILRTFLDFFFNLRKKLAFLVAGGGGVSAKNAGLFLHAP